MAQSDSVDVVVRDTIMIDKVSVDTMFMSDVDSVFIDKNRLVIEYRRIKDEVYIKGECKADTIYREKIVKVGVDCPEEEEPNWFERNRLYFELLLLGFVLSIIFFHR